MLCGLSAAAGALLSTWLGGQDPIPQAAAEVARFSAGRTAAAGSELPSHLTPEERVNIAVYEAANRSVVNINTTTVGYVSFFLSAPTEGAGSGSVLDRQGHILTNLHVVEDAQHIEVTLFSGNAYPARLIGKDMRNDLAVIKIDAPASELFPVVLGDSAPLRVGQRAYAIGNPFGLERTLTTGIVSSLNRSIPSRYSRRAMTTIIQIDAAMNPGNSGGPLLDSASRVIGMNTAIASKTGQNTGVGFAIPVNRIKRIVPDLIRYGRAIRPDVGISHVAQTEKGLQIALVTPDGPADEAGLQGFRVKRVRRAFVPYEMLDRSAADVIVAVDGQQVKSLDDFEAIVEGKQPGDVVELTILRQGREENVPLRVRAGE